MKALLLSAGLLATGCSLTPADVGAFPSCPEGQTVSDTVVLIAQAVPTAQFVPCVETLPTGWTVPDIEIGDGRAQIDLAGDEFGTVAVSVTLTSNCETQGAFSVPSDREGTRRYDSALEAASNLAGSRQYVFDGGCVTYAYDLRSTRQDIPVDEALLAVSLLPRPVVGESVQVEHDDRVELDPPSPHAS